MKRLVVSLTLIAISSTFAGCGSDPMPVPVEQAAAKGGEAAKDKAKRLEAEKARAAAPAGKKQ